MKVKHIITGSIVALVSIFVLRTSSLYLKKTSKAVEQEVKLDPYDINFVPESEYVQAPSAQLVLHEKDSQKKFSLRDFKGKALIVHFWGTDCMPCAKELPSYQRFTKRFVEIEHIALTIVPTDAESKDNIQKSLNRFGAGDIPLVTDTKANVASYFQIKAIPSTVFISKKGHVLGTVMGPINWDDVQVQELVLKILAD